MKQISALGLLIFAMLAPNLAGSSPTPAPQETAPGPTPKPGHAVLKGKPRLVRASPRTEVFFSDLRESYWILEDQQHNAFQRAFLEGIRKDKPVGFTADVKTRRVLSVNGVETAPPAVDVEELLDVESQR